MEEQLDRSILLFTFCLSMPMHDVLLFESVSSMCLMRFFVVVDRWCSRIRLKTRVLSEIGTFGHTMIRLYFRLSLCYPPLLVCAASSVGRRIVIMVVCDWLRSVQSIKPERSQTVFLCCCWLLATFVAVGLSICLLFALHRPFSGHIDSFEIAVYRALHLCFCAEQWDGQSLL